MTQGHDREPTAFGEKPWLSMTIKFKISNHLTDIEQPYPGEI
jgi:hypothetical protein